jgi:hypothetical protein
LLTGVVLLTVVVLLGVTLSQHGRLPGRPRVTVLHLHRRLSLLPSNCRCPTLAGRRPNDLHR